MTISSRLPRDPSVFRRLLNVRGEEDWSIAFRRLAALLGKVATAIVQSRAPRRILRPRSVASTKLGPATGAARLNPSTPLTGATWANPAPRAAWPPPPPPARAERGGPGERVPGAGLGKKSRAPWACGQVRPSRLVSS